MGAAARRAAQYGATKEAAKKANPTILEPMMGLEVVVPEDYLGSVMGDITSRRGNLQYTKNVKDMKAEIYLTILILDMGAKSSQREWLLYDLRR